MTTPDEIIAFAIDQESKAAQLYEKTAGKVTDRGTKQMLIAMSSMERAHEAKLRKISTGTLILTPPVGQLFDMRISDFVVGKEVSEISTVDEALIFAIKAEASAIEMYTRLAAMVHEPAQKALFNSLATEEKQHKQDLETEYDREYLREN